MTACVPSLGRRERAVQSSTPRRVAIRPARLGARACGEPYWDPDFQCADVFMLLDVRELNPRYARHFLKTDKPGNRRLAA